MIVPGRAAKHAIVTSQCRKNRTDVGAVAEAIARLAADAPAVLRAWPVEAEARFHFVFAVEANPGAGDGPARDPISGELDDRAADFVTNGPVRERLVSEFARCRDEGRRDGLRDAAAILRRAVEQGKAGPDAFRLAESLEKLA